MEGQGRRIDDDDNIVVLVGIIVGGGKTKAVKGTVGAVLAKPAGEASVGGEG
jgi:hypothetical protein